MSRFPTAGHLCAWAGVAPATHESAGKKRPAGTRKGAPWLRRTLIEAARAAARTKGSYYSALYARSARRRGPNKAAVAVAHSMLETPGTCSQPVPSTKTPVPTTSSAVTLRPARQSGSSAGSRPSGTPSPSPTRPPSQAHLPTTSPSSHTDRCLASRAHAPLRLWSFHRRDTGPIDGLDPGGGVFGPDGRYYVGSRRLHTVMAMSASLDGPVIPYLPPEVVPFPRGFAFAHDGRIFLASGAPSTSRSRLSVLFGHRLAGLGVVEGDVVGC
jgi:hypothetical protein